jgi:hypothetical protein
MMAPESLVLSHHGSYIPWLYGGESRSSFPLPEAETAIISASVAVLVAIHRLVASDEMGGSTEEIPCCRKTVLVIATSLRGI